MAHDSLKKRLAGVAFTTPTPFAGDTERVDHDALAENVSFLADAGAEVIVPCGNTGEYYALSHEERIAVVETHVEAAGDATVVAGLAGSTKTALDLLSAYEAAGVDAVMAMHPDHTYIHERGLVEYYRRIAAATDLGVVLYKRGPEVTRRVLREVSAVGNVVAVKYAVNDVVDFSAAVAESDDVVFLDGSAERLLPGYAVEGAQGFTTGIGNFAPEASLALQDAIEDGDWERARGIRELLRPLEDLRDAPGEDNTLGSANNVPVVKYGLELAGLNGGPVREPLVGLSPADRERVEELYGRIEAADL
ncbi:MAG: dihydrodipicolinate synthase family protein [Halobacteriales archaeon]